MTDYEKEEFWKGLNRLYEDSIKRGEEIDKLKEETRKLNESIMALFNIADAQQKSITALAQIAIEHGKRLDRHEQ